MADLTHALPLIGRHLAAPVTDAGDSEAAPVVAITGPHTTITVERGGDTGHRITIDIHTPRAA
ncbi:hypothetical protein D7223_01350 [Micromonospora endolithica]|uniref:Uncharacterized protein n=2 Tax=Micromonospora endolithica TaxID=230091 RepID=A0A3A9ZQF0_9ACTN|nr:hypothetical protein D7223_01350 [Micromonospora endolithica]